MAPLATNLMLLCCMILGTFHTPLAAAIAICPESHKKGCSTFSDSAGPESHPVYELQPSQRCVNAHSHGPRRSHPAVERGQRAQSGPDLAARPQKPCFCPRCLRVFSDPKTWKRHFDQKYVPGCICPSGCGNAYDRPYALRRHLVGKHGYSVQDAEALELEWIERQHAFGCGICLAVFTEVLKFKSHHAGHCENEGALPCNFNDFVEIQSLLRQPGLVAAWEQFISQPGIHVGHFIAWCVARRPGLRELQRLLEGDGVDLQRHNVAVLQLFNELSAAYLVFCPVPSSFK